MGDPGSPLCPVSAAWGLNELVLTVGMALLTSRPHVAMLMFIWGARRKVLPGDGDSELNGDRAPGADASVVDSPCCFEKIFFCLCSFGRLSITGLKNVT